MVPIRPEHIDSLQARFAQALTPVYDARKLLEEMRRDPSSRPGMKQKHVFDFEIGVRVIVSMEQDTRPQADMLDPYLHASFSIFSEEMPFTKGTVVREMRTLMELLSRGRLPVPDVTQTAKGIVHFFYDAWELYQKMDEAERKIVNSAWLGRGRFR